jgi:2'-5' RNA ligase
MRFIFLGLGLLLISNIALSQTKEVKISTDIYFNQDEPFLTHENALAMNIKPGPIKSLRSQIESSLGIKLDYFKGWNAEGEAHVTVITPPEFEILKSKLTMRELNAIAERYDIQLSRLMILGLGRARTKVEGKEESAHFLIVDSYDLRTIRQMIFYEFTRRGGERSAFDPSWFFPHITIGYTKRDLHESDGVIKNLKFALDNSFKLIIR